MSKMLLVLAAIVLVVIVAWVKTAPPEDPEKEAYEAQLAHEQEIKAAADKYEEERNREAEIALEIAKRQMGLK